MHERHLDAILKSLAPYRIEERKITLTKRILGRGGFGVVVLGEMGRSIWRPKATRTLVAVKQLHATGTTTENRNLASAFIKELQVWAGLAHRNIIPLVGFYLDDAMEVAWLISPYMKNGNIRRYLDQHRPQLIVRLSMFEEIASGIAYLHSRNLCHGDIKGENVLVDDGGQAKLCDFGLSRVMENGTVGGSASTGLKGSLRYMAPEFFRTEHPVQTNKTDVWAWTCLGLEILFDQMPYDGATTELVIMTRIIRGDPPLDLDHVEVDEDIKQLFKKCWVTDPQERVNINTCGDAVKRVVNRMQPRAIAIKDMTPSAVALVADFRKPNVEITNLESSLRSFEIIEGGVPSAETASPMRPSENDSPDSEVESYRQALLDLPAGHPDRPTRLYNLAVTLVVKHNKHHNPADLDEAIDLWRQTLRLRPVGHLEWRKSLYNLAIALLERYQELRDVADLDQAIDLDRQGLLLRPVGHLERHKSLYYLAAALANRYNERGNDADLDEAISLGREALQLGLVDHPEVCNSVYDLALALETKYKKRGDAANLDEAIDLWRQTLPLRPVGQRQWSDAVHHLATALLEKYQKRGDVADLDEAIDLGRQLNKFRPVGHPERHHSLTNLAVALAHKNRVEGGVACLSEVIDLYRQTVILRPVGHPERHVALYNLAVALVEVYAVQGDAANLDEAITHWRETLQLRPVGHLEWLKSLFNLAVALSNRYKARHDPADLDEAIELDRQALLLRPVGHPERSKSLNNLAAALTARYRARDAVADLAEVIALNEEILTILSADDPLRPSIEAIRDQLAAEWSSMPQPLRASPK